jgi:iron complex transport system substrate-binding protein
MSHEPNFFPRKLGSLFVNTKENRKRKRRKGWYALVTGNSFLLLFTLYLPICAPSLFAMRIVSLLPSDTEILQALGAGHEVVGVTRYDTLLKQVDPPQDVGDLLQPNMEKIVALHPDLILAGLWSSSRIVPRLRAMGFRVEEFASPRSFEETYASIRRVAQAIGRPGAARLVIERMQRRLAAIRQEAAKLPHRLRTYIEIDQPYWTVGGKDFLSEAVALAGGDTIFGDLTQKAVQVSPEVIIARDPELIISFHAKRDAIAGRPGWSAVSAVKKGFVVDDVSEDLLTHPSPRLVGGIQQLLERILALENR